MVTFAKAIEQISKANPFVGELYHCDEPLSEYAKNRITHCDFDPVHKERQKSYLEAIKNKINKLFPNEDLRVNYDEGMIVDTSDHHFILNFPTTLGAHMVTRFDTLLKRKEYGDYFVLDCGNVSLGNPLTHRGVEFAGKHLNLFPKDDKNKLISRYPLYKLDFLEWMRKSENKYSDDEIKFLEKLQKVIDSIDFSTCERFSDQIVKINYHLWQEMFAPEIRDDVRRCVTLEHDEILINYLADFILKNQDNHIFKALFNPEFRIEVLKEFNGVYGAWNYSGENTGTHFFWGYNGDGKEYRLEIVGDKLINKEGKVADIELSPESISKALKDGILIPAIFTKFALVAFYLGAKTMGGPGQTEYTEKLKQAWIRVLEKFGEDKELELIKKVNVLNYNCVDLGFYREGEGKIQKEWALDMIRSQRLTREYLEKIGQVSFKYFLYPIIQICYYRMTPAAERQEVEYTDKDLFQGFDWV